MILIFIIINKGAQLIMQVQPHLSLSCSLTRSLSRAGSSMRLKYLSKAILKNSLNTINSVYMGLDYTRTQRITKLFYS